MGKQFPAKEMMLDIERVRRFWEDAEGVEISQLVENVLSYTDLSGCDVMLISCIEGDDSAAVLALCIGKHLKSRLGKLVIIGGEVFPHMQPIKSDIEYFYRTGCFDYYIQGYGETALLELEQGGHDIHERFQLFTKFGEKHLITDFQISRGHQGFDYFGQKVFHRQTPR
ncbi:MAG: hypothetical protein K8F52_09775 [Candidatus Scalindua rubra]|nr:hypothetical protein [Candidatus Scalindua rubra]